MSSEPFRVLIAGGGLSGLALANCLELANIDYLLFEARPELTPFVGAGLCLNAGSAPLLEQFGVRKELFDKITPLQYTGMHLPNGDYLSVPQPGMPLVDKRYDIVPYRP
jgi:2-polyprenyl-6-methoxyphenol hydroxylase-like FAD-dependent oxidoreductase